ncbi:MAG: MBL fold metallo-hydrolase [Dehalococcoidia bacterium]|nr:MAG: MBL fold metallo-hydrolase [Dehalococcoidia bacterium]
MILKALELGPFAANCYIVGSEKTKEGMIIDPGTEAETIMESVRQLGLTIKLIVATHSHPDHIMALRQVKEATGAPFAMHEAEANGGIMQAMSGMLGMVMTGSLGPPPKPERLLKDGDIIEVGELRFAVLHTPGHSPGGISLYGHGVVFSGDTLFNFGIGRTDFPGCSHKKLMDSIHNKLMALPDETVVLPGHGPQTTIATERKYNPFLRD